MATGPTNIGEEYIVKTDFSTSKTLSVGLMDDSTDATVETDDLAQLTTEPSDGNYARQSEGFTAADISGDWGADNDTTVTFDVTSTTGTVDSYFLIANFTSVEASDGGATDHMILVGNLSTSYNLANLTELEFAASAIGFKLS